MQARRRAQPSGTNSPSSSHPRLKAPSAMRHLLPCPPCGRQGRPGKGTQAGSNTSEPRGSAPRERDHRGGDHPVPSRTRQLSPPSPRVLQRKAAGGQGVALAEGAFRFARRGRRRRAGSSHRARRERPAGGLPPAGPFCVMGPDRVGSCAFAASSAAHRRRALAASPGKPSKGPCARGPVRRRTAVYHAPVGPQRGALSSGPFQRFGEVSASRAALRALPASFRAAGSLAGPVLLAACVGGSVWAPSRAFFASTGV